MDGVVRVPSTFSITFGLPFSITATQELVVPRSMPIMRPMMRSFYKEIELIEIWGRSLLFQASLPLATITSAGRSVRSLRR